jgi:hypothetical protein
MCNVYGKADSNVFVIDYEGISAENLKHDICTFAMDKRKVSNVWEK